MKKRGIALLMALCMTLGSVPALALDAGEDDVAVFVDETPAVSSQTGDVSAEQQYTLAPNELHLTAGQAKGLTIQVADGATTPEVTAWASDDPNVADVASTGALTADVTGVNPGECTITATLADGQTLECPVTVAAVTPDPTEGVLANAVITMQGSTAVRLGNNIYMHATVTGLGGTVEGVNINWYVNGSRVSSTKDAALTDGDVLDLKTTLPKSTTRKTNKVSVKISKDDTTVAQSASVKSIFDFVGAELAVSKRSNVTLGDSMKINMKISGLQESLKGSYQWYVDGKAVGKKVNKTIKNGMKFSYTYKPTKSGKHTIKLVLKNDNGSRSLKGSKTVKVHKQFSKTLASYTTSFDASNTNRSTNVRLATKAINGKIIKPGKTFSFNGTVGERTAARGYKPAIIFVGGKQESGLGGGVCQVSSTLFNAVLMSNLKIEQRYCHSAPISYVPLGRDATVAYGSKDFKFSNNLKTPVKIVTSYNSSGSITMKIKANYGTKIPKVKLSVTRSGSGYCLKRTANGKVNYTTYSYY